MMARDSNLRPGPQYRARPLLSSPHRGSERRTSDPAYHPSTVSRLHSIALARFLHPATPANDMPSHCGRIRWPGGEYHAGLTHVTIFVMQKHMTTPQTLEAFELKKQGRTLDQIVEIFSARGIAVNRQTLWRIIRAVGESRERIAQAARTGDYSKLNVCEALAFLQRKEDPVPLDEGLPDLTPDEDLSDVGVANDAEKK